MEFRIWKTKSAEKNKFLKDVRTVSEAYCLQGSVGVSPDYANKYARVEADVIIIGYLEGAPKAFILAKHEPTSMYLGVICGMPGTGRALMDKFLALADKERENVSLSAMPNVLSYYGRPEFDFAFRKSCDDEEEVVDSSVIAGKKPPATLDEIARDPIFGPFLEKLQEKGFNVAKFGECRKRRLNAEQIIKNHCEDDGYTMFRCKVTSSKSPRRVRKGKTEIDEENSKGVGKRLRRSPSRLIYE